LENWAPVEGQKTLAHFSVLPVLTLALYPAPPRWFKELAAKLAHSDSSKGGGLTFGMFFRLTIKYREFDIETFQF
jgi:hypothetical protein